MSVKKFLISALRVITVVIVSSILLLLGLVMWWFFFSSPFDDSKFNKDIWIQADISKTDWEQAEKDKKCIKGAMVKDLRDNYLKSGVTTKAEVLSLLGDGKIWDDKPNCLGYVLGMCSGFGMDYDVLYICFDHQNRVNSAFTQQH